MVLAQQRALPLGQPAERRRERGADRIGVAGAKHVELGTADRGGQRVELVGVGVGSMQRAGESSPGANADAAQPTAQPPAPGVAGDLRGFADEHHDEHALDRLVDRGSRHVERLERLVQARHERIAKRSERGRIAGETRGCEIEIGRRHRLDHALHRLGRAALDRHRQPARVPSAVDVEPRPSLRDLAELALERLGQVR